MNPNSRIWIYQANRILNDQEATQINELSSQFVATWNSHGTQLLADIELLNNLHLVVCVDESHKDASGCSIDSSVRFVKALEGQFNLDFFDRMLIAYKDKDAVKLVKANQLNGQLNGEALVFNNLIEKRAQLENEWLVPAKNIWIANFL